MLKEEPHDARPSASAGVEQRGLALIPFRVDVGTLRGSSLSGPAGGRGLGGGEKP